MVTPTELSVSQEEGARQRTGKLKRSPGTGTLRERPPGSGRWQLRVFVGYDPITGHPRQVTKTFRGTEAKAKVALQRFATEVAEGKFIPTTASFGQVLDRWLEQIASVQRPRTVQENRSKINARIRPLLGHIPLAKLDAHTLDSTYRKWLAEGLSPTTVHNYHAIISSALHQAVKWGWAERAVTDRASPPSPVQKDLVVPTPSQLSSLVKLAAESDQVLATAVAVAALTGCRRGELIALRWSDVDITAKRLTIARSLTLTRGENGQATRHEGPTKTHQVRSVALDDVAVSVLSNHFAYMVDLSERAGSQLVEDPYLLSYNANGGVPVSPDGLTHAFTRLCETMEKPALEKLRKSNPEATRKDLPPAKRWPYRFHDLRHFSVTTLIAAGIDVRTVAERHGHAQATMTLNRYAHALPQRDRDAAAVIGGALSQLDVVNSG